MKVKVGDIVQCLSDNWHFMGKDEIGYIIEIKPGWARIQSEKPSPFDSYWVEEEEFLDDKEEDCLGCEFTKIGEEPEKSTLLRQYYRLQDLIKQIENNLKDKIDSSNGILDRIMELQN